MVLIVIHSISKPIGRLDDVRILHFTGDKRKSHGAFVAESVSGPNEILRACREPAITIYSLGGAFQAKIGQVTTFKANPMLFGSQKLIPNFHYPTDWR